MNNNLDRAWTTGNAVDDGITQWTLVTGAVWAIPTIAQATPVPDAAMPPQGLILPDAVSGRHGGGWTIATMIDRRTGYASVAFAARTTAVKVPVRISPPESTSVTLTLEGAGYSFLPVADGAAFSPSAAKTISVATDDAGNGEVYVAIPPHGGGAETATIIATSPGQNTACTLVRRYLGSARSPGGHLSESPAYGALVGETR